MDCFYKMGLKNPLGYRAIGNCYRFAECYEDPLAHKYMEEIAMLPEDEKSYVMEWNAEMLMARKMYVELLRWQTEEKYTTLGVEPELRKKLMDLISENRYFFANFSTDPWIEDIIRDLPETKEIPYKLKQAIVVRYYRMREFLDKYNIIRLVSTDMVAYKLLDIKDPSPVNTIRCLLHYAQDTEPEEYDAFFNPLHLNKINTYYTDILEGIHIYDEIALKRNIGLRICYEKLLLRDYQTLEQQAIVRACLELIMYACRLEKNDAQTLIARHIVDAMYYDDVDKTVLAYPNQLLSLMHNKDACNQLLLHIWEVRDAAPNNVVQREKLRNFLEN
jgi:hypothetical protein